MMGMTKYERICQPLVAVVACGLNIPPLVLGLMASANWCPYYGKFLVSNAVFCFINIGAAFFSIYKLQRKIQFDVRYNSDDIEEEDAMVGTAVSTASTQEQQVKSTMATSRMVTDNSNNEDDKKNNGKSPLTPVRSDEPKKVQENAANIGDEEQHKANDAKDVETEVELSSSANATPSAILPTSSESSAQNLNELSPKGNQFSSYHPHSCFRRCLKLRTKSSNRIRHLVCYNGLITTYGILFLFWAFWLGSGKEMAQNSDNALGEGLDDCSEEALDTQLRYVTLSVAVGYGEYQREYRVHCHVWRE
jgi:hypothetical protein